MVNPHFGLNEKGIKLEVAFTLQRNPSSLFINAYIPSFFIMMTTIMPLFLDERMHFTTSIMLFLTSQLCLYTLFQSSLQDMPKTEYLKHIDFWNMFVMPISLTNFFTLFLLEILQYKEVKKTIKIIMSIAIPFITLIGVVSYWINAGILYYGGIIDSAWFEIMQDVNDNFNHEISKIKFWWSQIVFHCQSAVKDILVFFADSFSTPIESEVACNRLV